MCQISTGKQMKQNTNKKNEEKKEEEGNYFENECVLFMCVCVFHNAVG